MEAAGELKLKKVTDELLERVATRLRAMGSPLRLRILHALEDGELSVTEIIKAARSSQANVSQHLQLLRAAGLVESRRNGMSVHYAISDPMVLAICHSVCDSILRQVHDDARKLRIQDETTVLLRRVGGARRR